MSTVYQIVRNAIRRLRYGSDTAQIQVCWAKTGRRGFVRFYVKFVMHPAALFRYISGFYHCLSFDIAYLMAYMLSHVAATQPECVRCADLVNISA